MDSTAVEAVLLPVLKAGFLLLLVGGAAAVVRRLLLLARSRQPAAKAAEKGKN